MSKVILSYNFDFYMMHVVKVSDHSYNIVNRINQFKGMWFRSLQFEQLQAGLSHRMDSSGTRECSNSGSSVIAVESSAVKYIFLRGSKQTVVCLEVHTLTSSTSSQNQRRRAPGSPK